LSQMLIESQDAPNRVKEMLAQDGEAYAELGLRLRKLNPSFVGTVARGSSDHAAAYAKYLIPQCTGRVVASIPPSVVTVLDSALRMEGAFVLALSQSGGSPDILATLERARKGGALTASLVNQSGSLLAKAAEVALSQWAGEEKSITATKSVLCTLTGIARIAAAWSGDQALASGLEKLPPALRLAANVGMEIDDQLLKGISHAFVISRGLGYGASTELALKFKETCGIHAEAFSTAELRHGPREIVDRNFLVIALALPGSGEIDVIKASEEMKAQGARVLLVAEEKHNPDFALPASPDFRLAPLLALQLVYPWIARAAVALGRNPDKPKTLAGKVIKTV
jgi:glucosamine--fructose-6-phosphate aminotransferase (isomerizing)